MKGNTMIEIIPEPRKFEMWAVVHSELSGKYKEITWRLSKDSAIEFAKGVSSRKMVAIVPASKASFVEGEGLELLK